MKSLVLLVFVAIALPAAGEVLCDAPGVTARVDPEVAAPGELVVVTLCNNTESTLNLPSSCVFEAVFASGGSQAIYTPGCLQVITPIAAGQSASQSWDQRDNSGQQVPNGTYVFLIRTGSGISDFLSHNVTIAEHVPALAQWGMPALIAASGLAGIWALRVRHRLRT